MPVLTETEREKLIVKMKEGDKKAKDMLVLSNLKLVLSIIQKVNSKNTDADDLFQVGCIGLIKALNNFNPDMQVQFSTYGVVMILGEMKRYIRDNNLIRISRSTKDMAYRAMSYKEKYILENSEEPTVSEIARAIGTTVFKVSNALGALTPTVSLYEPVYNDESDGSFLMDMISEDNFEEAFCSKTVIVDIFHSLKSREKTIMNLRYIQGKTQIQVAEIIGISQAQVSRIEKNILSTVKKQLES